jgi:hypothetical protein
MKYRPGAVGLLGVALAAQGWPAQYDWDPPAVNVRPAHQPVRTQRQRAAVLAAGEALFNARFNRHDGAGRPGATGDSKPTPRLVANGIRFTRVAGPDANSCAGCHNQPVIGGSGDIAGNVFVGAHFSDPPTLGIEATITNERNTTALFGSGAIEMLAREMTAELRQQREAARRAARAGSTPVEKELQSKGVQFGSITARPDGTVDQSQLGGIDHDLVVKPFGVKGVAISLREFTIAALNQHHGIQAVERFGWERTGRRDFDEDGVIDEFSAGQLSALTLFQALLPPLERPPASTADLRRGHRLFEEVGCTECHRPYLSLRARTFTEPNPYNRPGAAEPEDLGDVMEMPLPAGTRDSGIQRLPDGTLRVWAYTDLRRHRICDAEDPFFCNEKLRQDNVPTDQFMTSKLWDLAQSSPYGHRGDCDTVSEVILHHAGEARPSRQRFAALADDEKKSLVAFLLSLGSRPRERSF